MSGDGDTFKPPGIVIEDDDDPGVLDLNEYATWLEKERHLQRIRDEVLAAMSGAAIDAIEKIRKRENVHDDRTEADIKDDADKRDRRGALGFSFYDEQTEGDEDDESRNSTLDTDGESTGSDEERS